MRPFRSATLFLSLQRPEFAQDLRSQLTAEPRRGALGPYTTQDTCGSAGRERPGNPAGHEVPQKSMQAVERPGTLGHQIFAPFREQAQHLRFGLGIDRRQPLVARGGQRGGEGIEPIVLAGVASEAREHPHPCRKLGWHVHHGFAGRCQPHCQVPTPRPPEFSTAQRRSGYRFAQRPRGLSSRPGSLREASTLDELACGFVDHRDGYPDALWGSTPMSTFMRARTSVPVGPLPLAYGGHSDFVVCTHLF